MNYAAGIASDWDKDLPEWRDELVRRATAKPGTWEWRELPIGWRLNVMLQPNGCLAYRFRSPQYQGLNWHGFREEAYRLLAVLGCAAWRESVAVRRVFWEITFLQPEGEPAPTEGDAA